MASKIVWLRGTQIGREFELADTVVSLGRSPENTIPVGSGRASRRHAEIRADPGGYVLVDLDSANGTLVNGDRIVEPYRLSAGDLFEVGDELFRFEAATPDWMTTLSPIPATKLQDPPPGPAPAPAPQQPVARPAASRRRSRLILLVVLVIVVLLVAAIGVAVVTTRAAGGPGGLAFDLIGGPLGGAASPADPAAPAEWTILVYLAGDNNLEADALRDLNEMEAVGSSDQVRVVVEFDRAGRAGDGERWTSARRYLIARDGDTTRVTSPVLAELGEQNTGDPQTLADFVVWGVRQYPARRYALVIWDHGSAWAGTAFDTTSAGDGLSLPELQQALATAQAQLDGLSLDLIGFDACLMGQLDVLLSVAPYGHTAVASPELEPNDGWDWAAWLNRAHADPQLDGPGLARAAVETYGEYYAPRNGRTATLAAFDLDLLPDVAARTGAFADALAGSIDDSYRAVAEARSYAAVYSQPRPEEFSAVDLGDLALLAVERGAPETVAAPARELSAAIARARIALWAGPFHARSSGISVFFPQSSERMPEVYDQISPLAQQTGWARFVRTFLAAADARVAVPQITDLRAAVDPAGGAVLEGSLAGRDIAYVFFFVGIPNADRSGVQLVDIDYIRPPGGGDSPVWGAGPHPLREVWDAQQWNLDNGSATIPVLLGPARYDSDLYGVEGLYEAQDGSGPIDAALLFRLEGGQATLQNVYGFPRGQGRESQPLEINPVSGDRFTAQIRTYAVDGAQLVPGRVSGETITFGASPMRAVRSAAAPRSYVAGFLVRDIAGRFSYQYRDMRVAGS
jgi:hypothetical protein